MSTPTTKNPQILLGFNQLTDANLLTTGYAAQKGLLPGPGAPNPSFTKTPVDPAVLKTELDTLAAYMAAAKDGGRKAVALKNSQRKVVVSMLRQLAVYVEANCNGDLATLLSSGFKAKSGLKTATKPLDQPGVRKIVQGISGQLLMTILTVAGAWSYELHYAVLTGTTPGAWTTVTVTSVKVPVSINNLTPGTTYAFQVRALGMAGFTDWSDVVTRMSI